MPAEPETPGPQHDPGHDAIARAAAHAGISRDELLDRAAAHAGISREEFDRGRERVARTLVRFWLRLLSEQQAEPGARPRAERGRTPAAAPDPPPTR
jgi:hypothetical protein